MSLLSELLALISARSERCAIIGAAAMALHGVARSTNDIDVLLVGRQALEPERWESLRDAKTKVELRLGDTDDPLLGVVRLERADEAPIDIVVGASSWQQRILERTSLQRIADTHAPVAALVDLILLKLYAGSPKDCWDISTLLSVAPDVRDEVSREVEALPPECRALWQSILDSTKRSAT